MLAFTCPTFHREMRRYIRPTHRLLALLRRAVRADPPFCAYVAMWWPPDRIAEREVDGAFANGDLQREVLDGLDFHGKESRWAKLLAPGGCGRLPPQEARLRVYVAWTLGIFSVLRPLPSLVESFTIEVANARHWAPTAMRQATALMLVGAMDEAFEALQTVRDVHMFPAGLAALTSHLDGKRCYNYCCEKDGPLAWNLLSFGLHREERGIALTPFIGQRGFAAWADLACAWVDAMPKVKRDIFFRWGSGLPVALYPLAADAPLAVRQQLVRAGIVPIHYPNSAATLRFERVIEEHAKAEAAKVLAAAPFGPGARQ